MVIDFSKQKKDTKSVIQQIMSIPSSINKKITFGKDITFEQDVLITEQLQGNLLNNQMASLATSNILSMMTDPRFLNLQCEDPGAGTMTDASGQGHDGTYHGTMTTEDRIMKGMGWILSFDGVDDYISLGDDNDFSFGDGSNDEAVTWFGVIEVVNPGGEHYQIICSKMDETTGSELREWEVVFSSVEVLCLFQYDESKNIMIAKHVNDALSIGWHTFVITSPGDGGANAMDNVKIYVDGSSVACNTVNEGAYVAMENLACEAKIGSLEGTGGTMTDYMAGDIALVGMDGSEWSAIKVSQFHNLAKWLYGL